MAITVVIAGITYKDAIDVGQRTMTQEELDAQNQKNVSIVENLIMPDLKNASTISTIAK